MLYIVYVVIYLLEQSARDFSRYSE